MSKQDAPLNNNTALPSDDSEIEDIKRQLYDHNQVIDSFIKSMLDAKEIEFKLNKEYNARKLLLGTLFNEEHEDSEEEYKNHNNYSNTFLREFYHDSIFGEYELSKENKIIYHSTLNLKDIMISNNKIMDVLGAKYPQNIEVIDDLQKEYSAQFDKLFDEIFKLGRGEEIESLLNSNCSQDNISKYHIGEEKQNLIRSVNMELYGTNNPLEIKAAKVFRHAQINNNFIESKSEDVQSIIEQTKIKLRLNEGLIISARNNRKPAKLEPMDIELALTLATINLKKDIYRLVDLKTSAVKPEHAAIDKQINALLIQYDKTVIPPNLNWPKQPLDRGGSLYNLMMKTDTKKLAKLLYDHTISENKKKELRYMDISPLRDITDLQAQKITAEQASEAILNNAVAAFHPEIFLKFLDIGKEIEQRKTGNRNFVTTVKEAIDSFVNTLATIVGFGVSNDDIENLAKNISYELNKGAEINKQLNATILKSREEVTQIKADLDKSAANAEKSKGQINEKQSVEPLTKSKENMIISNDYSASQTSINTQKPVPSASQSPTHQRAKNIGKNIEKHINQSSDQKENEAKSSLSEKQNVIKKHNDQKNKEGNRRGK